jgi:bifunctional DNase/RNase
VKLKSILVRKDIALRIRQKFLDCVYFIERCQIPIMIKDKVLYDVAMDVEDSVKALFYL